MALSKAQWMNFVSMLKKRCRIENEIEKIRAENDLAALSLLHFQLALRLKSTDYVIGMYGLSRKTVCEEYEKAKMAVRKEEEKLAARTARREKK